MSQVSSVAAPPRCSLSWLQSLQSAPLSLPCAAAATLVAVEVCHRADVGLVAPVGRVIDPHAADTRVVGGTPGLKGGPVKIPQTRKVGLTDLLCYHACAHTTEGLEQHLGLKERREVGVRVHLPGHPARVDAILGAVRSGDGAVHDRFVLPDVEVP